MVSLTAAALAALIALAPDAAATPAALPGSADALLARYRLAIQHLKQPANMVVEYTQTRSGPTRVITENHRFFRDAAGHERNETSAVNGTPVTPPRVAIYMRASWPYGLDKFAVDSSAYQVAPRGALVVDGRKAISYAAVLKEASAFAITDLELDAKTAMPLREHFVATTTTCSATGSIDFGPAGRYWMPKIVSVTCPLITPTDSTATVPVSSSFRDTIRFSSYAFPSAIPAQVFGLTPSPAPNATGHRPP